MTVSNFVPVTFSCAFYLCHACSRVQRASVLLGAEYRVHVTPLQSGVTFRFIFTSQSAKFARKLGFETVVDGAGGILGGFPASLGFSKNGQKSNFYYFATFNDLNCISNPLLCMKGKTLFIEQKFDF